MFTIDFTKPWLYKDIVYFNQGNLSSNNILRCKIATGGDVTLEGYIGEATFVTLSRREINGVCDIVDAKNCIVDIHFPSNALEIGENKLEIILTKNSKSGEVVAQSPTIKYEVWRGVTTGNGVQSENNYPILIDLISKVNNAVRIANNASATADASLKQTAKMLENVDNTLVKANSTIEATNNAKNEALEAIEDVKKAIAAGTQDLEVKRARGKYSELKDRFDNLEEDLLKAKDMTIIPVSTESNFVIVEEAVNGYLTSFKIEGKTVVINSKNQEVEPGTEGATLKSVGDDEGEIVVSSVKGDGNLFDGEIELGTFSDDTGEFFKGGTNRGANKNKFILVGKQTLFIDSHSDFKVGNIYCYDESKKFLGVIYCNEIKATINLKANTKFVNFNIKANNLNDNFNVEDVNKNIYLGANSNTSLEFKSDKKKALYYDTESQTWKKLILREWDSIEEHNDGKYYYYQKSFKEVLNGKEIENWLISSTNEEFISFKINIAGAKPTGGTSPFPVTAKSDKFAWQDRAWDVNNISNGEGFAFSNTDSYLYVKIYKSKLETQNIEGFKTWLKTNPITVIYQLAKEKIYECTPIDLMAFENETNYMIECGTVIPKSSFKYEGNIGNVINTLKEKVSYLEDKLYKTNLANFTVALNALDTKLKLEQLTKTPK